MTGHQKGVRSERSRFPTAVRTDIDEPKESTAAWLAFLRTALAAFGQIDGPGLPGGLIICQGHLFPLKGQGFLCASGVRKGSPRQSQHSLGGTAIFGVSKRDVHFVGRFCDPEQTKGAPENG